MSTQNVVIKKMGRPQVDSERIDARFERPDLDAIDAYVAREGLKGRPEAVRRLVRRGLAHGG